MIQRRAHFDSERIPRITLWVLNMELIFKTYSKVNKAEISEGFKVNRHRGFLWVLGR